MKTTCALKPALRLAYLLIFSFPVLSQKSSIYKKGWIDFNKNGKKDIYKHRPVPLEDRVAHLLSQMTTKEKTHQIVTLCGSGRVLKDAAPAPQWINHKVRNTGLWDKHNEFVIEPETFSGIFGSSSDDMRLNGSFEVTGLQ